MTKAMGHVLLSLAWTTGDLDVIRILKHSSMNG